MSVQRFISEDNKKVTIVITDRFDFSLHQCFKNAYFDCVEQGTCFILELSETGYMDSSALGMILLLKEHVEKISGSLILSKPNEDVKKILEIAQFHRLMPIEN